METDKKIEEYLERAIMIEPKANIDVRVEIAKMIQLKEQHQDLLKLSRE